MIYADSFYGRCSKDHSFPLQRLQLRPEGNLQRVWEICEGGKGHHSSNDHTVDSLWKTLFNVCKAGNNYISKNSYLFILSRIISVLFQISAEGGCLCIIFSSLVWNFHLKLISVISNIQFDYSFRTQ